MKMSEVEIILKNRGVDQYIYNVGPPKLAECLVIEEVDNKWTIYVWERGQKNFQKFYSNENIAVAKFIEQVIDIDSRSSKK